MSISVSHKSAVNMGNILESDTTGSEAEYDDNNETQISRTRSKIQEERSQGDGRESDYDEVIDRLNKNMLSGPGMPKSIPHDSDSNNPGNVPLAIPHISRRSSSNESEKCQPLPKLESPKQLPPKSQLIPLKPERIPKTRPSSNDEFPQTSNKQREPKFVPYEPYAGAVRPMVDDYKKHSRKPSNSSTVSGSSLGCAPNVSNSSLAQIPKTGLDNTLQHQINHYKNQTHSMTLMKERLKIAEKDIVELQAENARLKKLMVDSMLGSGGRNSAFNGPSEGINGESDENLSDEIEVWRSKFMSSCILVDQLTKENREMKVQISSAAHLFREIKNTAGLTASLFDQINYWLSQNASQTDYNFNTSNDDYNYDLSPHPPSPYS